MGGQETVLQERNPKITDDSAINGKTAVFLLMVKGVIEVSPNNQEII
jgi:hypothetical protein